MSKLKSRGLDELLPPAGGESNDSGNDMKEGLLAIVVKGPVDPPANALVSPKPKSIRMAPSVAVCGLSSNRFSIVGSNDVNEFQSILLPDIDGLGDVIDVDGEPVEAAYEGDAEEDDEEPDAADGEASAAVFGTLNVNFLRFTFSSCNRESRSRRFSFSETASTFLASSAATLSSNWER